MNGEFAPLEESSPPQQSGGGLPNFQTRYAYFGEFCLDLKRHELYRNGSRVKMQGKVWEVLLILMETPGALVTREALRARLWPPDTQVNYDANVNTAVNKLRQVLGDSSERSNFVETVPRKGYSFIAAIEYTDTPPKSARPARSASLTDSGRIAAAGHGRQDFGNVAMSSVWFKAGVVALLAAAMLLGAAIMLYTHH